MVLIYAGSVLFIQHKYADKLWLCISVAVYIGILLKIWLPIKYKIVPFFVLFCLWMLNMRSTLNKCWSAQHHIVNYGYYIVKQISRECSSNVSETSYQLKTSHLEPTNPWEPLLCSLLVKHLTILDTSCGKNHTEFVVLSFWLISLSMMSSKFMQVVASGNFVLRLKIFHCF